MTQLIAITGTIGAGKGTVVDYLLTKGFLHFSVRRFLTQEILQRKLPVNRDSMVTAANDIRAKCGADFIVKQLLEQARMTRMPAVIESIRTMGEVSAVKNEGVFLLAVDADPKTRYDRIVKRNSSTDNVSFEEFLADEKREMHSHDPTKQSLSSCMAKADRVIRNDGSIEELHEKVDDVLELLMYA